MPELQECREVDQNAGGDATGVDSVRVGNVCTAVMPVVCTSRCRVTGPSGNFFSRNFLSKTISRVGLRSQNEKDRAFLKGVDSGSENLYFSLVTQCFSFDF